MGALISQTVALAPETEDAFREALGDAFGEIKLSYDGARHMLEVWLLPEGVVQWAWWDPDTVVWTGLDTPSDEGWLSFLSGALPPVAAQMGFTRLIAPVVTEKLAGLLPLTGLEPDEHGVLAGDLGRKHSRFWSYLDFKAGRAPEPAWRRAIRGP